MAFKINTPPPAHWYETAAGWWQRCDNNWPELFEIMATFLPVGGSIDYDGGLLNQPLAARIVQLHHDHNRELCRYLHAAWATAPDRRSILDIDGWDVLCDLLSEEGVLYA